MEFIKPSVHFAKVYSNKTKDVTYLKTDDIEGAQPKKYIYDKSSFRQDYINHLSYCFNKGRRLIMEEAEIESLIIGQDPKLKENQNKFINLIDFNTQDDNYQLPVELNERQDQQYNQQYYQPNYGSVDQGRNMYQNNQPENKMVNYNYASPSQSYQQKYLYSGPQTQKMRNPMFADFDYEKYNTSNVNGSNLYKYEDNSGKQSNIQIQDSLDQFRNQYASQQNLKPNPSNMGADMKESWLKFYGVPGSQSEKHSRKEFGSQSINQDSMMRGNSTDKISRKSDIESDPHFVVNMHKFFGDKPPSRQHFEKNRNAFFRGFTPSEEDNSRRKGNSMNSYPKSNNIFRAEPKEIVVLNPLSQSPFLRYQSQPKRVGNVKVETISSQWQLNQQANKFF